ncbi:multi-sensor hybrid histidine kinase [Candidatus Magnetomorum sp. HK-1]|nr:multi-sensor hybrid histidine kinase [Candidatus Magnetomorum sp. HK-1]
MRKYFQIYMSFIFLAIFCFIVASQWILSTYFTEQRIQKKRLETKKAISNIIEERSLYAKSLINTLTKNPELSEAIQFIKLTGDTSLCEKIIGPSVHNTIYEVIFVDMDSNILFSTNKNTSPFAADSWKKISQRLEKKNSFDLMIESSELQIHCLKIIKNDFEVLGILDVYICFDEKFIKDVFSHCGSHVTILNKDGKIMISSHSEMVSDVLNIQNILIENRRHKLFFNTIDAFQRLLPFVIFIDIESAMDERAMQFFITLITLGSILFLSLFLNLWITSRMATPLEELAFKARTIADGDYSVRVDSLKSPIPEIESILHAFNQMSHAIEKNMEELIKARSEAEAASDAKSEFLANMSHEIRTPLNGVTGMLSLLSDSELNESQKEYVDICQNSASALLKVINDILDFSKIEAGKLEIEFIEFNLKKTINNMIPPLRMKAQEKNTELLYHIDNSLPKYLKGDPGRIRQILINLIGNAIKFTDKGKITLDIKIQKESDSDIILYISVSDTGIGIPKDKQSILFNAFSQADTSVTREYGGTGLGLSISQKLVKLMKGTIGLESKINEGSTFWFTIHLCKASVVEGPKSNESIITKDQLDELPQDESPLPKAKVQKKISFENPLLLVEDNLVNQKIAEIFLKQVGCLCDIASNGEEAIKKLSSNNYALVLMDIQMPVMDGITATKIIRDPESTVKDHNIPIIAMTAHAMKTDGEKFLGVGMNEHLTKPLSRNDFFSVLDKYQSSK